MRASAAVAQQYDRLARVIEYCNGNAKPVFAALVERALRGFECQRQRQLFFGCDRRLGVCSMTASSAVTASAERRVFIGHSFRGSSGNESPVCKHSQTLRN